MTGVIGDGLAREARRRAIDALAPGATTRTIRWSGGATDVIELGTGEPMLLVHGGAGEAGHWLPLLPLLAEDYRVIAVDAPGHGLADPHDFAGDLYALGARFIGEVLTTLGIERAIVAGNSMGGTFAVGFALAAPERVSQLLLIGAPAATTERAPLPLKLLRWPWTRPLASKVMRNQDAGAVRTRLGRLLVAHPERLHPALIASFAATTARNVPSLVRFVTRAIDLRGRIRPDAMFLPRCAGLRVPTSFIWGELDRADAPASGRRIAAQIVGATLVQVPDAGHQPALDDAVAVARAIRSLASVDVRAVAAREGRGERIHSESRDSVAR
jgi:pimeloyl-ACP methyl ester carboxylesterase